MKNEDLDAALVDWDTWRERNPGRDLEAFAQEHGLTDSVCAELKRVLKYGNDIGKIAADFVHDGLDFATGDAGPDSYSAITKERLTRELGHQYEFLSPLGTGGMGTVWLAMQKSPIRRKVAIKLIRNDLVSPATRKRFAFEQQALASLSHQNIATVHEAGETQQGRSYFIMEFIPGEKITDFCNRRKLDLEARLKLFLQVCEGVQYAHRRGLIHRDLKPGNIIVMEENDIPVAKVIDFGLAKDTAKFKTNESLTQPNAVLGSPAWMSPEQAQVYVDGDKVEIDTRTDVYSLGVILYQLLTNSTPIPKQVLRESPPAQVFDAIRHQLPAYPSQRLSEHKDDSKSWIEDSSDSNYSAWVSNLRDDLDWVVMKAIEKDVSRRYENIGEFASDIKRFIDGESVTARPPSKLYQFKKIVGRNRILATSIAVIAATLIVATFIATSYAIKASRAQQLAERRLKGSEQITEVFASAFEVLSYFDDSVENTELKKKLLREVGRQMELKAAAFPPDLPPEELAEREFLWRSKYVRALNSGEMDEELIEQLNKVIGFLSPVTRTDDERLVDCRNQLSSSHLRHEDFDRAKQVAADNLLIVSEAYAPSHELAVESEIVWLRAFIDDRTFEENESKFKELIERSAPLEDGVNYQIEIMKVAAIHAFNALEKELGLEWLDRAQKLAKEKLEKNSPVTVDLEFEYWMQVVYNRSKKKVDLEYLETRIHELSEALSETHPIVLRHQTTLVRILNVLGNFGVVEKERAITLVRKILDQSTTALGAGHPVTSVARSELLRCLSGAGKFEELVVASDEHLELLRKYGGEDSDLYLNCCEVYLDALLETRRFEVLLEKARLFQFPREEAGALIQLGRFPEAIAVLEKYVGSQDPKTKQDFDDLVPPYRLLAEAAFRAKDYHAAIEYLEQGDEHAKQVHPLKHPFRLEIKKDLIRNLRRLGRTNLAMKEGKQLLDVLLNEGNAMPQDLRATLYISCLGNLFQMHAIKKDFESAKKYASLYFDSPITHEDVPSEDYVFKTYLGIFEFELGNDDLAEQHLMEAIEATHSATRTNFNMARTREQIYATLDKVYRRRDGAKESDLLDLNNKN